MGVRAHVDGGFLTIAYDEPGPAQPIVSFRLDAVLGVEPDGIREPQGCILLLLGGTAYPLQLSYDEMLTEIKAAFQRYDDQGTRVFLDRRPS